MEVDSGQTTFSKLFSLSVCQGIVLEVDLRTAPVQVHMCVVLILFWRLTPNRRRFSSCLVLASARVLSWSRISEQLQSRFKCGAHTV